MSIDVLIVDDEDSKCLTLKRELIALGVRESDIYVAKNAVEARRNLGVRQFALLLLDLNLPLRADGLQGPKAEVGAELLREVVEDQAYNVPDQIVGVTADLESMTQYSGEFQRLTSQILLVAPGENAWKYSLQVLVSRLTSGRAVHDYDICILSALREPEQSQVLAIPCEWMPEEVLEGGVLFRRGRILLAGTYRRIVSAHCPQMGLVSATFVSRLLIEVFRPRLLLMNGVCGGVGEDPRLGDLIIAQRSWDWQSGKWKHDGSFDISPEPKEASAELSALALGLSEVVRSAHLEFAGVRPPTIPRLLQGPMVSGSAVVADSSMHSRFKLQHRKAIAVDMECYGLYYSANSSKNPEALVLCVKGVSDLADRAKSDDVQDYCSFVSAKVLLAVADRFFANQQAR